jgi:hypothetical protein
VSGVAVPWSAVDDGHVVFVVPLARGRRKVVQPFDLSSAQLDAVGGGTTKTTWPSSTADHGTATPDTGDTYV